MVYVDDLALHAGDYKGAEAELAERTGARSRHRWCHLYADTEEELHRFAIDVLGLRRRWAQVSRRGILHYDLTPKRRAVAVRQGARELTRREAFELRARLRAARSAA
jgi:hypothetical protein